MDKESGVKRSFHSFGGHIRLILFFMGIALVTLWFMGVLEGFLPWADLGMIVYLVGGLIIFFALRKQLQEPQERVGSPEETEKAIEQKAPDQPAPQEGLEQVQEYVRRRKTQRKEEAGKTSE